MTAFNARAWIQRWEAAGGGYGRVGDKLSLMLPEPRLDELNPIASELRGQRDKWLAVKLELAGKP